MMFARSIALLVVAAVVLVQGIVNGTGRARGPVPDLIPMTIGASCPAEAPSCGCMPHMCTDLATIGGTATLLTYLCPETKTVQVTKTLLSTVLVTVHDGVGHQSTTAIASTGDEKTTTVKETRKSTLYVTKTIQVKKSTTTGLTVTITGVSASNSAYTHVIVPQSWNSTARLSTHPVATRSVEGNSTSSVSILPVYTESANLSFSAVLSTASQGLSLRASFSSAGIWLNSTTTDAIVLPTPSGTAVPSGTVSSGTTGTSAFGLVVTSTSATANSSGALTASATASPINVTYLPPVGHPKPSSPVISDLESFPSIVESTGFLELPSDSVILPSIFEGLTHGSTVTPATLTDGTFFSSDLPARPTALAARKQADNHTTATMQSVDATTTTDPATSTTSTEAATSSKYRPINPYLHEDNAVSVVFGFTILLPMFSMLFMDLWA